MKLRLNSQKSHMISTISIHLKKIRSRRAVKRPSRESPSSRCPSRRRFAPYPGSKRRVAGQVPLFERNGSWVNGVQLVICILLPGPNWRYRNSSTRCQAFACSIQVTVLSVRVRSGCVGLRHGVPTFGGGEGWVFRPLIVLIDALGA